MKNYTLKIAELFPLWLLKPIHENQVSKGSYDSNHAWGS